MERLEDILDVSRWREKTYANLNMKEIVFCEYKYLRINLAKIDR